MRGFVGAVILSGVLFAGSCLASWRDAKPTQFFLSSATTGQLFFYDREAERLKPLLELDEGTLAFAVTEWSQQVTVFILDEQRRLFRRRFRNTLFGEKPLLPLTSLPEPLSATFASSRFVGLFSSPKDSRGFLFAATADGALYRFSDWYQLDLPVGSKGQVLPAGSLTPGSIFAPLSTRFVAVLTQDGHFIIKGLNLMRPESAGSERYIEIENVKDRVVEVASAKLFDARFKMHSMAGNVNGAFLLVETPEAEFRLYHVAFTLLEPGQFETIPKVGVLVSPHIVLSHFMEVSNECDLFRIAENGSSIWIRNGDFLQRINQEPLAGGLSIVENERLSRNTLRGTGVTVNATVHVFQRPNWKTCTEHLTN